MTGTLTPADPVIKDFSHRVNVQFKIDDDVFEGIPDLPALDLVQFIGELSRISETDNMREQTVLFEKLFRLMLVPESADRFVARMGDREKPISLQQIQDIMPWMLGEYGLRPTEPSSDSTSGSEIPDDGKNSMETVQPAALTSVPSQQSDSST